MRRVGVPGLSWCLTTRPQPRPRCHHDSQPSSRVPFPRVWVDRSESIGLTQSQSRTVQSQSVFPRCPPRGCLHPGATESGPLPGGLSTGGTSPHGTSTDETHWWLCAAQSHRRCPKDAWWYLDVGRWPGLQSTFQVPLRTASYSDCHGDPRK